MSRLVVAADGSEPNVALCAAVAVARAQSSKNDSVASKATALSNFEIANWSLLRATCAHYPLRFVGASLRLSTQLRPPSSDGEAVDESDNPHDFHPWSAPVRLIDDFLSHSWHDPGWLKVVVLLLEYNGLPAVIVGTTAAFVASGLFAAGVLPGMEVIERRSNNEASLISFWGQSTGCLFFVSTLLCWRSRRLVFLDKICISQVNEKKKLDAVMGIGAFLKASKRMLVMMDSTYTTRLWCIFELAAYSKLMESDSEKVMCLRPLAYGRIFICVFSSSIISMTVRSLVRMGYVWPSAYNVVHALPIIALLHNMRRYQDAMEKLSGQLLEFSMDASKCYCCQVCHVHPDTSAHISCDREAVQKCIESWWGSIDAFTDFVRNCLHGRLARDVGCAGVPYWLVLWMHLPHLWFFMDYISAKWRQNSYDDVTMLTFRCIVLYFLTQPCLKVGWFAVSYGARRRLSSRFIDTAVSFGLIIPCLALLIVMNAIMRTGDALFVVSTFVMAVITSLAYGAFVRCRLSRSCTTSAGSIELSEQ
eukprot:TRINITY_DN8429_c0_g1_i6.p1 TRINITY_DN8429_c0_g1~~TRINITY_DN8429_c0_g1_i6.p1  ORF type:complete len:533 (-),score=53.31 TRINITY_DN8429_c0_g1_i6:64-1662(-)